MRICFYAAVRDRALFDVVEFYRQDIRALRDLGHEVVPVRSPRELTTRFDLYWVWWPTSGMPAVLAGTLGRRPTILVTAISDRDPTSAGFGAKPRWVHWAAHASFAAADLTLATSDDTRAGLARFRTRRLRTAYLGVDTGYYRPTGAGRQRNVVTVSHLTPDNVERKRIVDVVETAALVAERLPDLRFTIVGGEGAGAAHVRAAIDRLGVEHVVRLAGRVSAQEKRDLLASAAVYFQPTRYEAFGVAIAEALACGTPVLSNAVGAVPEVVGDTGCLLPAAAGPADFARELERMCRGPEVDDGVAGRLRIQQRFSLEARRHSVERALADVG